MDPHSFIWLLDPESAANTSFAMINTMSLESYECPFTRFAKVDQSVNV
jgi:hypothetical protein